MVAKKNVMDDTSHLFLHRTLRELVKEGITVMTKGEGVRVFDQDGNSYPDLVSGVTRPVHVGYGRKEIAQAVYDQICQLPYFTPMQFSNRPAMQLAEVLAELAPGKINKFTFVCDGSEAVEAARPVPAATEPLEEAGYGPLGYAVFGVIVVGLSGWLVAGNLSAKGR